MINVVDVIEIVVGNMAEFADTGRMSREGAEFFDSEFEIKVQYNTNKVNYIVYQELGTKFFNGNMGFISIEAEGKLKRYIYSQLVGEPYNFLENNQVLLENQSKLLTEQGAIIDV